DGHAVSMHLLGGEKRHVGETEVFPGFLMKGSQPPEGFFAVRGDVHIGNAADKSVRAEAVHGDGRIDFHRNTHTDDAGERGLKRFSKRRLKAVGTGEMNQVYSTPFRPDGEG